MVTNILKNFVIIAITLIIPPLKANTEPVLNNETTLNFNKGEAYGLVRESLITSGWSPVISANIDKCIKGDVRCENRPEMETCSGSGLAPCKFVWRKNKNTLNIFTVGMDATDQGDAAFDSYELFSTE